jgi:Putative zinc-finger
MTDNHRSQGLQEHRDISALLPWYVNDSIGEHERQRVDSHLERCANCREDLARELRVFQGMNVETPIEYMPTASLKRLQARLDGISPANAETVTAAGKPAASGGSAASDGGVASNGRAMSDGRAAAGNPSRRPAAWMGLMAASVAIMAVALSLLATDRWTQFRARPSAPNYYTVTTPTPRAPDAVIRAVFAPTITLVELQSLLDEAQLRIVSGPTEAGVYSLAANSRRPVNSSLALLRTHAKVRFAESTQPSMEAGRAGAGDTP